jgi:cardiolipin synthase
MANFLTISRIILILPFAILLYMNGIMAQWGAFLLFITAGITDFLDGYVARKYNQTSALGAALDPIADKLLTAATLILLVMNETLGGVHVGAGLVILLREVWVSGLREALAGQVTLPVTKLAKWKTTFQFVAFALLLLPIDGMAYQLGLICLWLAALLTIWTGLGYTNAGLKYLRARDK